MIGFLILLCLISIVISFYIFRATVAINPEQPYLLMFLVTLIPMINLAMACIIWYTEASVRGMCSVENWIKKLFQ